MGPHSKPNMRKVAPSSSVASGHVNSALLKMTYAKKEGELFALRPLKEANATQDITIRQLRATLLELKTRLSKCVGHHRQSHPPLSP